MKFLEMAHRAAIIAGNEFAWPFTEKWFKGATWDRVNLASRAAFCVGYDRYMYQAHKAQ